MIEVREVLRSWLAGDKGLRRVGEQAGVDRKIARRYVGAAEVVGLGRHGGEQQLIDALVGEVVASRSEVVLLAGDGYLMMTVSELATAVQYSLAVVVLVAENGSVETIRMHQKRYYPVRVGAGRGQSESCGAGAFLRCPRRAGVMATTDFPAALHRAGVAERPVLLERIADPRRRLTAASPDRGAAT